MIPVIDLFAGPGGLGEGFSSLRDDTGTPIFNIVMSVECDPLAYQTLRLRSYTRKILKDDGTLPRPYISYMKNHDQEHFEKLIQYDEKKWEEACNETVNKTLKDGDDRLVNEAGERLKQLGVGDNTPWILIGGPPCQAYSLVGRSRRAKEKEKLENDIKQTLYKCYLAFIHKLKPTIFVMENVKGLLSATHHGHSVLDLIMEDMKSEGYDIRSLVTSDPCGPSDYIVRSELYGVPQARHRLILLGVREDLDIKPNVLLQQDSISLREALIGIPKIRSGFSMNNPGWRDLDWAAYINKAAKEIMQTKEGEPLTQILNGVIHSYPQKLSQKHHIDSEGGTYNRWYRAHLDNTKALCNHEARSHIAKDLDRYLFCAAYAEKFDVSPKLYDFPENLLPAHANAKGAKRGSEIKFADRFRVQLYDRCSTTITSHIAKDGHYYIHPDPIQCRSLSVREAARLQTFPDNYLFEGNRTSQYTQVGNAVPPLLAQQIASIVAKALGYSADNYFD